MDVAKSQAPKPENLLANESLGSWKEIANYLKCDERTVRRWETEGLPVHRHMHKKRATVYAYRPEIDVWWTNGRSRLELGEVAAIGQRRKFVWSLAAGFVLVVVGFGSNVGGLRDRVFGWQVPGEISSIAVLPLKNLSADREQDYFADGMTEALITQLGKISALDVISHQSILAYRGATKSLPQKG